MNNNCLFHILLLPYRELDESGFRYRFINYRHINNRKLEYYDYSKNPNDKTQKISSKFKRFFYRELKSCWICKNKSKSASSRGHTHLFS